MEGFNFYLFIYGRTGDLQGKMGGGDIRYERRRGGTGTTYGAWNREAKALHERAEMLIQTIQFQVLTGKETDILV